MLDQVAHEDVENTLTRDLPYAKMVAIAASLTKLGN